MPQWEYLTQTLSAQDGFFLELDQQALDELGTQGWELLQVLTLSTEKVGLAGTGSTLERCQLIFKRPLL